MVSVLFGASFGIYRPENNVKSTDLRLVHHDYRSTAQVDATKKEKIYGVAHDILCINQFFHSINDDFFVI